MGFEDESVSTACVLLLSVETGGGGGLQFKRWKGIVLNLLRSLATSESQQCAGSVCGGEGAPASPREAHGRAPAAWGPRLL